MGDNLFVVGNLALILTFIVLNGLIISWFVRLEMNILILKIKELLKKDLTEEK